MRSRDAFPLLSDLAFVLYLIADVKTEKSYVRETRSRL